MTTKAWYEKASAIFEEEVNRGCIATNYESGFLFANAAGTYALFIPGYAACSAVWDRDTRKSNTLRVLYDKAMHDAQLATEQKSGRFSDRKCKVREFSNGNAKVYVYEKLLRMFPKNALYYISAPTKPIIVGLWENDKFHEIGMVMPMISGEFFCAD